MKLTHVPRIVNGCSLVLAPLFMLLSAVALPGLRGGEAAQIELIGGHQERWYVYALFILLGSFALVPAYFALMHMLRERSPFTAIIGGGLAQLGALVAIGDSATELFYWQLPGSRTADVAAAAHRYETAAGSSLVYTVGGLATMFGIVLLAFGLWRTRVAPAWAAALVPIGVAANIVGFGANSVPLVVASCVVLLAGLGRTAIAYFADGAGEAAVPSAA